MDNDEAGTSASGPTLTQQENLLEGAFDGILSKIVYYYFIRISELYVYLNYQYMQILLWTLIGFVVVL